MKTVILAAALAAAALAFPRDGRAANGGQPVAIVHCQSGYLGAMELGPVPMNELHNKLDLCRRVLRGEVTSIEIVRD